MDPAAYLLIGLVALFCLLVISQFVILGFVLRMRKRLITPEELLEESKRRTSNVLYKSIQQANKILVNAELKGIQLLSRQKVSGSELAEEFQKHLKSIEEVLQKQMEENAKHAETTYTEFITATETMIKNHVSENEKVLHDKAAAMVTSTEQLLTKFTAEVEEKIKGEVQKEVESARNEIIEYKEQRMRILDERIVDILEEVLRVVLEKKMSLADQSDLVYKALEEAKRENAFVSTKKN